MAPQITDSEMEVLRILLERGKATATEVHKEAARRRPWAHATVVTFLRRLEGKGLIEHTQKADSRAFIFQPTRKARAARQTVLRQILDCMFGGNPVPMVSSLLDNARLHEDQLAELRRMIDEHESHPPRGKKR
ncbi:MAG: BlaI/MecI/CopY family transcriptional regulator [Candidatus Sumerlaeota bacterium]|nr:BlaI/MecI/CopY family transcriptional regulator [Candidatus Sumerlaeota bacterium]